MDMCDICGEWHYRSMMMFTVIYGEELLVCLDCADEDDDLWP